jgi:hypothetical protein
MNKSALRFNQIIDKLDNIFREGNNSQFEFDREKAFSYVIIKLHDQWNFRLRQIVMIDSNLSEKKMMTLLRQNWTRNNKTMDNSWEPDWHIVTNTIRAGRLLNIPNLSNLQNSIGAVTYNDDIRWTRNAIVHNISASFRRYRIMTLNKYNLSNIMPYQLLNQINPVTGNTIYEDWSTELSIALQNAI